MLRNNRHTTKMDPTNGVSEVIGVILLISLVIIAIAIVGAFLFSQQTPQQIPNINFMTGSDGNGNLLLFHNGGDSLTNGAFFVTVDQVPKSYTLSGGGNVWSLGKTLIVTGVSTGPHTVQIIYNVTGSSGGVLLRTASANVSTSSLGSIGPDVVPTPTGVDCSAVNNPACFNQISPDTVSALYMQNLSSDYIIFGRDSQVTLATTGFFNFTVTKPGSSIQIGTVTPYPYGLFVGDKVNLTMRGAATSLKIFAIGGEIWELRAVSINYEIRNTTGLRSSGNNFNIFNANITGCTIDSTLDITSTNTASNILLVMNDTVKLNANVGITVNIDNMQPTKTGLFSFIHDAGAPNNVYFIGKATRVTVNGVTQV